MWRQVTSHPPIFKFPGDVPVYDMMMLWKFQVNWIIFDSARAFNIFFSFNMEGYGEDLFYPQSLTFDQPLCPNHLQWRSGWPIVGSVLTSPSQKCMFSGPILPHFCWCQHFFSNFLAKKWKWRLVTSDDVMWLKNWSHLHTSSPHNR